VILRMIHSVCGESTVWAKQVLRKRERAVAFDTTKGLTLRVLCVSVSLAW